MDDSRKAPPWARYGPEIPRPDWSTWSQMDRVQIWQAVALSVDIDPDGFRFVDEEAEAELDEEFLDGPVFPVTEAIGAAFGLLHEYQEPRETPPEPENPLLADLRQRWGTDAPTRPAPTLAPSEIDATVEILHEVQRLVRVEFLRRLWIAKSHRADLCEPASWAVRLPAFAAWAGPWEIPAPLQAMAARRGSAAGTVDSTDDAGTHGEAAQPAPGAFFAGEDEICKAFEAGFRARRALSTIKALAGRAGVNVRGGDGRTAAVMIAAADMPRIVEKAREEERARSMSRLGRKD